MDQAPDPASKTQKEPSPFQVVGWREMAALPDWGIPHILAKVDTGARTSAVHVETLEELGDDRIRFDVVVREQPKHIVQTVEADVVRWSKVRPSFGDGHVRPVVRTRLQLGPWERVVEIGLVRRSGMLCRMLIGREAMQGLLVDPHRRYALTDSPTTLKRRSRS